MARHVATGIGSKVCSLSQRPDRSGESDMRSRHLAGYLYIATNALMPGLVKVGRTQGSVDDRLRRLYSTGVPCPFVAEKVRFFVDCFSAELSFLRALESKCTRCDSREFFHIDTKSACVLLDEIYRNQHLNSKSQDPALDNFESSIEETFRLLHARGEIELAQQTALTLSNLPHARSEQLKLFLLARVMEKADEEFSCWLIRKWGVDPESPVKCATNGAANLRYYLTCHEYSIYLQLPMLELYLERMGCDIRNSSALCYVIDALINRKFTCGAKLLLQFGRDLVERGVNTDKTLDVNAFIEAPRWESRAEAYQFDLFPRNCNLSCREIIKRMAEQDPLFEALHQVILGLNN